MANITITRDQARKCHKTITCIFDELDALGVPFIVQNIIICWAENWRNYKEGYTLTTLKNRGVTIA